jgi:hypothetical protein
VLEKEIKKVTKTKTLPFLFFLKNENKNRKTGITKLFAKRPLLMITICKT